VGRWKKKKKRGAQGRRRGEKPADKNTRKIGFARGSQETPKFPVTGSKQRKPFKGNSEPVPGQSSESMGTNGTKEEQVGVRKKQKLALSWGEENKREKKHHKKTTTTGGKFGGEREPDGCGNSKTTKRIQTWETKEESKEGL